jgi:hypothetical protein
MKMKIFLLLFLFPIKLLAVYDLLSIDITPVNDKVKFCFYSDYPLNADTYLVVEINKKLFFIDQNKQLKPFNNTPPIFSNKAKFIDKPICFDPISKAVLKDITIYAGVGTSIDDIVKKSQYAKIFNGLMQLPQPKKKWTVMVYMIGSDLELRRLRVNKKTGDKKGRWASQDILEMLAGSQNTDNVNLVVSTGGSIREGWKTVKRSVIQKGEYNVVEDLGVQNMATPKSISDFVVWSHTNFPAENYALILWDHGVGSQGYGYDISKAGSDKVMGLAELHKAYKDIRSKIAKPLEIVVYDACLMASIEVAQVTAAVAKTLSGSADLEPGHGIDYAHLMTNISASPPADGISFGKIVKTGYIQHTKNKNTFDKNRITYSVFDLSHVNSFSDTFKNFALEFKAILKKQSFFNYQNLSRGIIRAPGYPLKQAGRLRSLDNNYIRIDLYSVLKTIGPDFPKFKQYTDQLLGIIDKMVVDYEGNIANIDPNAGRVSLDIGSEKSYLSALPEAYTLLKEGLEFYNQRRKTDQFTPDGTLVCPQGIVCAFAQWLELSADDILGIEAYFGQMLNKDVMDVYRIDKSFYTYKPLTTDLELPVDGTKACQYQICVNETNCENVTLTEFDQNQMLADIKLNDSPAILSFCNSGTTWSSCGVVPQIQGIWGRDDVLSVEDRITPITVHLNKNTELEQKQSNTLIVIDPEQVILKPTCDSSKAAISAAYYSNNQLAKFEKLCDSGDCVCKPGEDDPGCKRLGFKAGVILKN